MRQNIEWWLQMSSLSELKSALNGFWPDKLEILLILSEILFEQRRWLEPDIYQFSPSFDEESECLLQKRKDTNKGQIDVDKGELNEVELKIL